MTDASAPKVRAVFDEKMQRAFAANQAAEEALVAAVRAWAREVRAPIQNGMEHVPPAADWHEFEASARTTQDRYNEAVTAFFGSRAAIATLVHDVHEQRMLDEVP